jgi:hypothetical protein
MLGVALSFMLLFIPNYLENVGISLPTSSFYLLVCGFMACFVCGFVKNRMAHLLTSRTRVLIQAATTVIGLFVFALMPSAKTLEVTSDMIGNFESFFELAAATFLTKKEQEDKEGSDDPKSNIMREYKKKLLAKYIPQIDIEELEKLANEAREKANKLKLAETIAEKNLIDDSDLPEEGAEEEA